MTHFLKAGSRQVTTVS